MLTNVSNHLVYSSRNMGSTCHVQLLTSGTRAKKHFPFFHDHRAHFERRVSYSFLTFIFIEDLMKARLSTKIEFQASANRSTV